MLPSVPTLALTCILLLAAGYVILIVLTIIPRFRSYARGSWPLMMTETLIVCVVAGAIWIGGWVLNAALLALVIRCVWEAAAVARLRHAQAQFSALQIAAGAAVMAGIFAFLPLPVLVYLVGTLMLFVFLGKYLNILQTNPDTRLLRELFLFPIAPLLLLCAAGMQGYGSWLLIAFIFVETFDSYALGGGQLFGRHKAFPTLSPRKTIEGLAFGTVALMLTAALASVIFGLPILPSILIAFISGCLTVAGDLAASAMKRRSGVKDFPTLLPRQGGLLDIADAWIATAAGLLALAVLAGLV